MDSINSFLSGPDQFAEGSVYGRLHSPMGSERPGAVVLTHGAGSNCDAQLLVAVAEALAVHGFFVLRCNLAFRQRKSWGPPHPSKAAEDRESLREAAAALRKIAPGKLIIGGHSYGGRQASMLAAEDASVADSLLLLSYPLHPPGKPDVLRTAHFERLTVPSLFVHGTKDGFGTIEEMQKALKLIAAPTALSAIQGAGHELARGRFDRQDDIVAKLF